MTSYLTLREHAIVVSLPFLKSIPYPLDTRRCSLKREEALEELG
jgi:hypothetical protein